LVLLSPKGRPQSALEKESGGGQGISSYLPV